jgi:hypothetical protein
VPSHVLFNLASLVLGSLASCMDGHLSARAFWVLANGSGTSHGPREAAIDRRQHVPIEDALLQAAKLVKPALDEFCATLSREQKARFNALGQFAER